MVLRCRPAEAAMQPRPQEDRPNQWGASGEANPARPRARGRRGKNKKKITSRLFVGRPARSTAWSISRPRLDQVGRGRRSAPIPRATWSGQVLDRRCREGAHQPRHQRSLATDPHDRRCRVKKARSSPAPSGRSPMAASRVTVGDGSRASSARRPVARTAAKQGATPLRLARRVDAKVTRFDQGGLAKLSLSIKAGEVEAEKKKALSRLRSSDRAQNRRHHRRGTEAQGTASRARTTATRRQTSRRRRPPTNKPGKGRGETDRLFLRARSVPA